MSAHLRFCDVSGKRDLSAHSRAMDAPNTQPCESEREEFTCTKGSAGRDAALHLEQEATDEGSISAGSPSPAPTPSSDPLLEDCAPYARSYTPELGHLIDAVRFIERMFRYSSPDRENAFDALMRFVGTGGLPSARPPGHFDLKPPLEWPPTTPLPKPISHQALLRAFAILRALGPTLRAPPFQLVKAFLRQRSAPIDGWLIKQFNSLGPINWWEYDSDGHTTWRMVEDHIEKFPFGWARCFDLRATLASYAAIQLATYPTDEWSRHVRRASDPPLAAVHALLERVSLVNDQGRERFSTLALRRVITDFGDFHINTRAYIRPLLVRIDALRASIIRPELDFTFGGQLGVKQLVTDYMSWGSIDRFLNDYHRF